MKIDGALLRMVEEEDLKNGVFEIPEGILFVGAYAFSGLKDLKRVVFPRDIKEIQSYAFSDCENLERMDIPDSVRKIGSRAFEKCKKLREVKIGNRIDFIPESCFSECVNLKNVKLPDGLKEIRAFAFDDCVNLEKINFPEDLETIHNGAFTRCLKIKNVRIPKNVHIIMPSSFEGCKSLKAYEVDEKNQTFSSQDGILYNKPKTVVLRAPYDNVRKNLVLPKSVSVVERYSFDGTNIENLTFEGALEDISALAFYRCNQLKSVKFKKGIEKVYSNAFLFTDKLEEIVFPEQDVSKVQVAFQDTFLRYLTKSGSVFKLSKEKINDESVDLEEDNVWRIFPILVEYWDKRKEILLDINKSSVKDLYLSLYEELSREDFEKLIQKHRMKFYNKFDFENVQWESKKAFTKFFYNMGGFSTDKVIEEGQTKSGIPYRKEVDYAQKAGEFILEEIREHNFEIFSSATRFMNMDAKGFKKEFADFLFEKNNFEKMINKEMIEPGFISRCYNEFENVQRTNTSHKGSQRQLKPTFEVFDKYFIKNKFKGVTEENKYIADEISPFYEFQRNFDLAVNIKKEYEKKQIKPNILNVDLKEENPFDAIDELASKIEQEREKTANNLVRKADEMYSYEWLKKDSATNYILGKLCSCCAHLAGEGVGIMRASILSPNIQNLVIRDEKNNIIAKSTLYVNKEEQYGVFNNVEVYSGVLMEDRNAVYEKYKKGVLDFIKEYNLENPEKPLKQVNVGMGRNDLALQITEKDMKSPSILKALNFSKYAVEDETYIGDSIEEQYVLWEDENERKI